MDRLNLLGPACFEYGYQIKDMINKPSNKSKKALSAWTYRLDKYKKIILESQLKEKNENYFYIYVYVTKKKRRPGWRSGSGFVDYKLKVTKFEYSDWGGEVLPPEPELVIAIDKPPIDEYEGKSRGWYYVVECEWLVPHRDLEEFHDFDTGDSLNKGGFARMRNRRSEFFYVRDQY